MYVVAQAWRGNLHTRNEVDVALRLVAEGWSDYRIARATGISRRTILDWRHGRVPAFGSHGRRRQSACPRCDGVPIDEPAYAYLLGLYLGDGHISKLGRTYRLRIFQDERYQLLIDLAKRTIIRVRGIGGCRVAVVHNVGCVAVSAYWNHWPCVLPQHGPGAKHRRPIRLTDWQDELVNRYPRQLLRGLIHSDGCRVMNKVWRGRYAYTRYFFTNHSEDILQIFRDCCDTIGVPHRDSRWDTISIARREGVAALDSFIGPKA
jgi:hypothetical protein